MAVYKRRYSAYTGSLTPEWSRFFVLTRYAFADLFKSRFFVLLLILSLIPTLFFAGYIFIANNKTVQLMFQMRFSDVLTVETQFFVIMMIAQTQAAFLLNCWVGPVLVSGDLTNGALPLFLSRPFNRSDYVFGKLAVLGLLLSAVTWVPCLLLFSLQSGFAKQWLAVVAFVDGCSDYFVLSHLDLNAFHDFSRRIGLGQVANRRYRRNLHLASYSGGPRRDVRCHHGHLLGRTPEFLGTIQANPDALIPHRIDHGRLYAWRSNPNSDGLGHAGPRLRIFVVHS